MRVCVDSRQCQAGDLFFALPGQKTAGHHHLQEAKNKGASAAIIQKGQLQPDIALDQIEVDDVLLTLQQLARSRIASHSNLSIMAITGSLGKTTTRYILQALLSSYFSLATSRQNYNSQIGLPLTVLNELKNENTLLLLEMAMTAKSEIANLVSIAPPQIALITTIDYVHAQNFSSLQEIALAKAEIFSSAQTRSIYLPKKIKEREFLESLASCPIHYYCEDEIEQDHLGMYFRGLFLGKINLPAPYLKRNLAGALAVALDLQVPHSFITQALEHLVFAPGRLEKIEVAGITLINDAYNASGMREAIESLENCRIAVLGSIPELGPYSDSIHKQVAVAALEKIEILYTIGEEAKIMHECWIKNQRLAYHFDSIDTLCDHLFPSLKKGDQLFLKGKNTLALGQIVGRLQKIMNEK